MTRIRLNTFDEIKNFANVVTQFASPIEVWRENDNKVYNAKSLLSVICILGADTVLVDIKTYDADERSKFNNAMEVFK